MLDGVFQTEVESEQRTYTVGTGKVLQMVFLSASTGDHGQLDPNEHCHCHCLSQ